MKWSIKEVNRQIDIAHRKKKRLTLICAGVSIEVKKKPLAMRIVHAKCNQLSCRCGALASHYELEKVHRKDGNGQLITLGRVALVGVKGKKKVNFTGDHIIPRARGGANALDNIQLMCNPCNAAKADRLPSEEIFGRDFISRWEKEGVHAQLSNDDVEK